MEGAGSDLLRLLSGLGAAGPLVAVLFWMYWRADTERQKLQVQLIQLLVDTVSSRNQLSASLEKIADKVGA